MKTYIATAIAAIMFAFAGNTYANTTATVEAHGHDNHAVMHRIAPTRHCHCHTCNELNRHRYDARFAMKANATHHCNCPTCNDIRHNEKVARNAAMKPGHHNMAHNAPKPKPRPTPNANRHGATPTPGRR